MLSSYNYVTCCLLSCRLVVAFSALMSEGPFNNDTVKVKVDVMPVLFSTLFYSI